MTRLQFKTMMEGLMATAIEKICVLGLEDSKADVEKIIDFVEDLENFGRTLNRNKLVGI